MFVTFDQFHDIVIDYRIFIVQPFARLTVFMPPVSVNLYIGLDHIVDKQTGRIPVDNSL
ncbi:hypothetical protein DSECCO2_462520 [anaerobic digester metagenome]